MKNSTLGSRGWRTIFLTPALVLVLAFFIFPVFFLIGTSMTDWTGGTFSNTEFINFKNFIRLFGDEDFWMTMRNTVIWMLTAILIHVPMALLVALILFRKPWGWRGFRIIYFFPQIVAPLALAYMWIFIYNPTFGIVNDILKRVGLESLQTNWLGNPRTALGAIIFSWLFNIGFFMVIFLSQLGTISKDLYEASKIDGANVVQQDLHISLPQLKNTIGVTILLALTNTFKAFELPFIMTGGGPGVSSQIMPIMMFKQMVVNRAGRANAIATLMLILGTLIVVVIMKSFKIGKED